MGRASRGSDVLGGEMKLHWSPRSPQVRKVMIVAHELGLADRMTRVRTVVDPKTPNTALMEHNPLSKIPTLVLDDGTVLYDSPVICEHLDSLHPGPKLIPSDPNERRTALRRQALGDGFTEFLLLLRNESERDSPSEILLSAFATKRQAVLMALEKEAGDLGASSVTIGHIAIGSALAYLDFRFSQYDWRRDHPRIARWYEEFRHRPSVRATELLDDGI
jgi:glutathione S-transferase